MFVTSLHRGKIHKRGKNPISDGNSIGLIFFSPSLIPFILRYYEDFKIDLKTGEANLTQLYLQVLFQCWLLSQGDFLLFLFFGEILMAEDKFLFIVVYRKLWILLASSRPASSHSFYTGQLMLPTLLFMPPNSSWARVREGCKFCLLGLF